MFKFLKKLFSRKPKTTSNQKEVPQADSSTPKYRQFYKNRGLNKIQIVIVIDKDTKEAVTFVADYNQAEEYIYHLAQQINRPHYEAWCALHSQKIDTPESWQAYFSTTGNFKSLHEHYSLLVVSYTINQFCGIMRSVTGRMPLGCSYETGEEAEYLKRTAELQKTPDGDQVDDDILEFMANMLGANEENLDPEYEAIVDDTVSYFEERLIKAGLMKDPSKTEEDDKSSGQA